MSDWKPKPRAGLRWESLELTGEDGFVLSRLDGHTPVDQLVHVCGLPADRVQASLARLVAQGAVDDARPAASSTAAQPPIGRVATRPPAAAARAPAPVSIDDDTAPDGAPVDSDARGDGGDVMNSDALRAAARDALREMSDEFDDDDGDHGDGDDDGDGDDGTHPPHEDEQQATDPTLRPRGRAAGTDVESSPSAADEDVEREHGDEDRPDDVNDLARHDDDADDGDNEQSDDDEGGAVEEGNWRKLYMTRFSELPEGMREQAARSVDGAELLALCFDPLPQVVRAVLDNAHAGFEHARLIVRHHRVPQGLDAVMARAEFARDAQVQRWLLRNPMLQEPQCKKLLQHRPMPLIYKVALDRDLPERNRSKAKNVLRARWIAAQGEERADLIFSTEGRVLNMLLGLPFDSHTTSILCSRTYNSNLLIQNLVRFSATPPQLILHLLKQNAVRRQPHLKKLVLQHPNCPSDARRRAAAES